MRTKEEIEKLVEENISLVDFILYKHFRPFINLYPYLVDDLKQEGCIGLIKAAEQFDATKGAFTTIATFKIKNAMLRFYQRYVKKHYNNKNLTVISSDVNVTDDERITSQLLVEQLKYSWSTSSNHKRKPTFIIVEKILKFFS